MKISVIICTHNPREDYLRRTLDALKIQSLMNEHWELLVIDNGSRKALAGSWDLSWHPMGRHIREDELGLTPARLRGIREARGEFLIFIDDDNVVDANYVKYALEIFQRRPYIGAFGGSVKAEFEDTAPQWIQIFLPYLAIGEVFKPVWGNSVNHVESLPFGAGMCIHRSIAMQYANDAINNSQRKRLDRIGECLNSCGDTDMVFYALNQGYGAGRFPELRLLHLISRKRLEIRYLLKLSEGISYSSMMLKSLHSIPYDMPFASGLRQWAGHLRRLFFWPKLERLKFEAGLSGRRRALKELKSHHQNNSK